MTDSPARLVVLISGNGSNLQAILDACAGGSLPARVTAVFSDKPDAFGLIRAGRAGVPAILFPKGRGDERREYDRRLADEVLKFQPDYIILAGWMRILSAEFLDRFPGRIINLHPALPGTFPGTHAIQRAYEAWQRGKIDKTGVMVHLVPDEGVDSGPVLGMTEIEFQPGESLNALEQRIHSAEHSLLVETMKEVIGRMPGPPDAVKKPQP